MMKKISILLFMASLLLAITACDKDEEEPPTSTSATTIPPDTTSTTVVEVDINGLAQNFVKAEGLSTDKLYRTIASKYTGGIDGLEYVDVLIQGDIGHSVQVTLRGNELREGNFKLKKWALGGSFSETEAVVQVAVRKDGDTALMDFETSDNSSLSIKKDASGFFVIKMEPLVGINRNSWQPSITESISFHLMTNPAKVVSDSTPDPYDNIFKYKLEFNQNSNQPFEGLFSDKININFYDYNFSATSTMPIADYQLNTTPISVIDQAGGTGPQRVEMTYLVNWVGWQANMDLTQNIQMELTETTIRVKYDDIDFVNPSDPNDVITASGEWEIPR